MHTHNHNYFGTEQKFHVVCQHCCAGKRAYYHTSRNGTSKDEQITEQLNNWYSNR